MATRLTTSAKAKKVSRRGQRVRQSAPDADDRVLYLYAISRAPVQRPPKITAEGIDGAAPIEPVACRGFLCWISRVPRDEFADHLTAKMENLEWLASAGLRHQRAVAEISGRLLSLPARFGTVFLNLGSMTQHIRERERWLRRTFAFVAEADEWGIKVFQVASPKKAHAVRAASGADYLKHKAESLRPRKSKQLDDEMVRFIEALTTVSVATAPGGKASAGQPGLLWHGSFLVRRKDRKQLEAVLQQFAKSWQPRRRIDCSGPWPPYSFAGDHAS